MAQMGDNTTRWVTIQLGGPGRYLQCKESLGRYLRCQESLGRYLRCKESLGRYLSKCEHPHPQAVIAQEA